MSSTPPDPRNTHKPSSATLRPLTRLSSAMFETPAVLKRTTTAGRKLAELKGLAASMPNQGILINTLGLQEAKDSSAIENIVTTHDELFRSATYPNLAASPAAKEVRHYVHALRTGYDLVRQHGLMTANDMLSVQAELEQSNAGFRRLPGTTLKDGLGRIVYTPPQDHSEIVELMSDLERFLLTQSDRTYVLDTKWKRIDQSLSNASDKYGLSQPDFYQLFAYGERYLDGVGEMLLVYPMTRTFSAPLPVFVYSESLTLRVVPFDLERGQLVGHELHGWS